tara:strand:- start:73 stop:255 length:183 start_codon:yes stop_codon:yes gene_type:complete
LTNTSEAYIVFIIHEASDSPVEIGRYENLKEAKKQADQNSDEQTIGYVYLDDNRVVYATQ